MSSFVETQNFTSPQKKAGLFGTFVLLTGVAAEDAGRGELTEFVSHHVLRDIHGDELVAVMHSDSEAHEVGGDHGRAGPGLDGRFLPGLLGGDHALFQFEVYIRSFF